MDAVVHELGRAAAGALAALGRFAPEFKDTRDGEAAEATLRKCVQYSQSVEIGRKIVEARVERPKIDVRKVRWA